MRKSCSDAAAGLAKLASVVGQCLDCEDRAKDICSLSADLTRATFHYALHCVMS